MAKTSTTERVKLFVQQNQLCTRGDRVLVACSGGPDSVALLDILRNLAPGLRISLGVLHVDHGQYPGSDRTLSRVRDRCRRWSLPFHASRIGGEHLLPGASETALRQARLRTFSEVADAHNYTRVATGHTESDQVETVLMRILRGATTAGLCGIPAMRDQFIRPLLCTTREELETYLKSRRIVAFEDPTNMNRRHLRNRIRHDILPMIRRSVNPSVDLAILRLSNSAWRDNQLLTQMAQGIQPDPTPNDCVELPIGLLVNLHDAVLSRVLNQMLQTLCRPGTNLTQQHTEQILKAIRLSISRPRFALDLPGGIQAYHSADSFGLRRGDPPVHGGFHLTIAGPSEISLPQDGARLRFVLQTSFDPDQASSRHVFFDAGRAPFPLVVRSVAPGDRLSPWGVKGSRKVARMLLDAKIPRHARSQVPVLVCQGEVLWVAGLRRSRLAPVKQGVGQVLSVEWFEDTDSG